MEISRKTGAFTMYSEHTEMPTMTPENRIVRPEVATATPTASATCSFCFPPARVMFRRASSSRNRLTTNRA